MKLLRNPQGFFLTEFLIAVVMLGILVVCGMSTLSYIHTFIQQQRVTSTRNRVADSLTRLAGMPSSIRASIYQHPENAPLAACVKKEETAPGGAGPSPASVFSCIQATAMTTGTSFRLYLPFLEQIPGGTILTSTAVSGTSQNPIRYNMNGELCDTLYEPCSAQDWPIEVVTEFTAQCPPIFDPVYDQSLRGGQAFYGPIYPAGLVVPSTCPQARYVKVRIQVRSSTSTTEPVIAFKPIDKTLEVDVRFVNNNE